MLSAHTRASQPFDTSSRLKPLLQRSGRMPFLELTVACTQADQPRYERALETVGALSVTLQDAHLDAADEQAIFEPGVGEIPLWNEMVLAALFEADTNPLALLSALEDSDPSLDWSEARFRTVEDQDWERAWLDQFQPLADSVQAQFAQGFTEQLQGLRGVHSQVNKTGKKRQKAAV